MSQSKQKGKRAQSRRSPWPVLLVVGGVLLVAGVIAASLLGGSSPSDDAAGSGAPALSITAIDKSPEAQVDGLKVDFGAMQLGGELATLQLTLKNTGDGALKFSEAPYIQLADGCWPPKPVIGSMTLQPGETTTVSVEFSMHGDMGGPHDFRLHLPTNDPAQPDVVVTILSDWVEWEYNQDVGG